MQLQSITCFTNTKEGGATEGYCTHCRRKVKIKNPKYNQTGTCSRCGQQIQFKSVDKAPTIWTERESAYLIQRCKAGIVLRRFEVRMMLRKGEFQNPEIISFETKRFFYNDKFQEDPYYYGDFKNRGSRWIGGEGDYHVGFYYYYYSSPSLRGKVYPRTLSDLEWKELRETGLIQWIQQASFVNPRRYFDVWRKLPALEQIVKADLPKLAEELLEMPEKLNLQDSVKGLAKKLEIDNARLKRLRNLNGGTEILCWLRQEKKENLCLSDE